MGGADWRDDASGVFWCVWSAALTRLSSNNSIVHDKAGKATFKVCLDTDYSIFKSI